MQGMRRHQPAISTNLNATRQNRFRGSQVENGS
jgi:hypothetical protein